MNIVGTNEADSLDGTGDADVIGGGEGNDILNGLGGDDQLDGGSGADRMAGGSGNDFYIVDDDSTVLERNEAGEAVLTGDQVLENADSGIDEVRSLVWLYTLPDNVENLTGADVRGQGLYGNALDNVITGFTGDDGLSDSAGGDDRLYGGDGDDSLSVLRYEDHGVSNLLLDGGADWDVLTYFGSGYEDTVTLLGGDGDDHISIFRGGAVTIDAGAGSDRIGLNFLGADVVITLGSGADSLIIQPELGFGVPGSIAVTDFETGDDGDRFVLDHYLLSILPGWDPATNIFGTGFVALVQDGADVVFRVDEDGPAGPGGFTDLVRFENRQVADFTQFNLGGYAPDGGAPGGVTASGGAGHDVIWGTFEDDVLLGLEGHDELIGGAGDDRLEGGNGWNRLDGQFGSDLLIGGDDHDVLFDGQDGDDRLFGGGEWDDILVSRDGDAPASTVLLDGGDGGDRMFFSALGRGLDTATLLGGEGNDDFFIAGSGTIVVDGGAGDDFIDINNSSGLYTVTLGAGYDQLYLGRYGDLLGGAELLDTRIVIRDFAAGELGPDTDVLYFRDYLEAVLPGWDGLADPFAAGYLTLSQDGADAVIRLDVDGPSGEADREFIRLTGVDAGTLTAYNLNALQSLAIAGTDADETITAGAGDHALEGRGGNDRLTGGSGDDVVDGGSGHDVLRLHDGGDDSAYGGAGNDNLFFIGSLTPADVVDGGEGTDTLILQGPYGSLALSADVTGIENISILAGSNTNFGGASTDRHDYVLTINDANFAAGVQARINGSALLAGEDFTFDGSAETDALFVVYGGRGKDTLTGGLGNDIFFYAEDRFASGDTVNGGVGYDGMFLRGNYTIDFTAAGYTGLFTSIENLTLTSATDERYARGGGTEFDYNLILSDAIVGAGQTLTVSGALLMATETMIFDASQESDGALRLFGGKASDTLKGGALDDLIHGNLGADILVGNGGADVFRYQNVAESNLGSLDQILDFTPGADKVDVSRIDANSLLGGDQAFAWIGSNAFTNTAGELRAQHVFNGDWRLEGDTDGNGIADFAVLITLPPTVPPGVGDFIL